MVEKNVTTMIREVQVVANQGQENLQLAFRFHTNTNAPRPTTLMYCCFEVQHLLTDTKIRTLHHPDMNLRMVFDRLHLGCADDVNPLSLL